MFSATEQALCDTSISDANDYTGRSRHDGPRRNIATLGRRGPEKTPKDTELRPAKRRWLVRPVFHGGIRR